MANTHDKDIVLGVGLNTDSVKSSLNGIKNTIAGSLVKSSALPAFENVASSVANIGQSAASTNKSLKIGFKTFLRYGIGVRSLFALINKLRRAISAGFEQMSESYQPFGKVMYDFKSAMTNLRNSFSAAFAPLLQQVLPIITVFIDRISQALSVVGKFIAALQGKDTFIQAVRSQDAYADSLKNTAKSANKAKRELLGFDEITKLSDKDTSNKNKKSGKDKTYGTSFQPVAIDSYLKNLANKIKDLIKQHNWQALGTMLGESINSIFKRANQILNSKELSEKINLFVDGITRTFNWLVKAVDWDLVGSTIASGLNLIINTLNRFLDGIYWAGLGASLGKGISSIINNVNWKGVGKLLGNQLNIIPRVLTNVLKNIDFHRLGFNLAKGLDTLISTVDWDARFRLITSKYNSIFSALLTFAKTFKWKDAAKQIVSGFNTLIKEIKWKEIGEAISEAMKGALSFIATALEEINWKELGENVKEFLKGIDWAGVAQALFESIGAALGGLAAFLWGLIEEAWTNTVIWWVEKIEEAGGDIWAGLANGIKEAFSNIGKWIKDNIVKPFIDGFKKAFGIASPSKEMKKLGGYIIDGMLQGILNGIKNIASWIVTNIFNPIKNGIVTAFGIAGDVAKNVINLGKSIIGGIKSGITNVISTIGSFIKTNVFTPIKNGLTTAFGVAGDIASGVVNIGKSIFEGVKKGISDAKNNVTSWFTSNVFTPVKDALTTAFDIAGGVANKLISTGKSIVSGIKKGIEGASGGLTSRFTQIASTIKGAFTNTNWASIGSNICSGIARGIYNGWNWLVGYVKSLAKAMFRGAKSALGIHSPSSVFRDEVGKMIPAGLALGIEDNADKALDAVSKMSNALSDQTLKQIKLPDIVSGKVVPYSSGIEDKDKTSEQLNMMSNLNSIIQEAILNAIDQSDGLKVTFVVQNNADKLFNVVRQKGLQYQQVTGNPVFP